MTKKIRDTAAAKSLAVHVIMKDGDHVGTVQAHFSMHGVCTVDVWSRKNETDTYLSLTRQGRATGYGYDKFTAALSGAVIDGKVIFDHGDGCSETRELLHRYKAIAIEWQGSQHEAFEAEAIAIGAIFANATEGTNGQSSYSALHMIGGLDRLTKLGYTVIKAL